MKSYQDIEKEIIETIVSKNELVTFLGITGSLRGFVTAVSLKMRDLWYELTKTLRKLFYDTSSGEDLDRLVNQMGITRAGASKAGALLLFSGTEGTVIPVGTIIYNPTTNIGYETKQEVVVGAKNPGFVFDGEINVQESIIGDIAWAECLVTGVVGRTSANSITKTSISGITVTNPAPAQGGNDVENDDQLRYRAKNYVKILSKNTQKFYEALCVDVDERILRTKVYKDYTHPDSISIIVITKSGAALSAAELISLANGIKDRQKTFSNITCYNIAWTYISVSERVKLKGINNNPVDFNLFFTNTSDALAKYFDWTVWEFGQKISTDDVFLVCESIDQVDDISLPTFKINGSNATSILIPANSLPYFQSLEITNITHTPVVILNTDITQSYLNLTTI